MNPHVTYQVGIARIDDLQRQAVSQRHAAKPRRTPRSAWSPRRWRGGRGGRPAVAERFA